MFWLVDKSLILTFICFYSSIVAITSLKQLNHVYCMLLLLRYPTGWTSGTNSTGNNGNSLNDSTSSL